MEQNKIYIAIDLKSFYASVECQERGLDPLTTHLVVADGSRSEKRICLAVSPSVKACGVSGRPRLFEVVQRVRDVNRERRYHAPYHRLAQKSYNAIELKKNPSLELDYIVAPPRMAYYIEYSSKIYDIYLKYIAPEDIHVYSIDEVFMDVTAYLHTYQMTAQELAKTIMNDVLAQTGITATAGIGTNMYLCKVAMDIVAKHIEPDENGARMAYLDEITYRQLLWSHRPLTDFWRVGKGIAKKLEKYGMYTMGDVARCSIGDIHDYYNEDLLYRLFGVNAELLIDHAWGYEPCTIDVIKQYKPMAKSIGSGQVLHKAYTFEKGRLILKEMVDKLVLEMVDQGYVTNQLVLTVGYDIENLEMSYLSAQDIGEIKTDAYGRNVPKSAHGTEHLETYTSSTRDITNSFLKLYDRVVNPRLLLRKFQISVCQIQKKSEISKKPVIQQLNLFEESQVEALEEKEEFLEKEERIQKALLSIQKKYGKNMILKGMNFEDGATTKERNQQIGGHKA